MKRFWDALFAIWVISVLLVLIGEFLFKFDTLPAWAIMWTVGGLYIALRRDEKNI